MLNNITNGLFYPKRQKFLYKPSTLTLGEVYSEIPKEKRNFYYKHYKKLLKIKPKKHKKNLSKFKTKKINNFQRKLVKKPTKSLINPQVLALNFNLTQKETHNLRFLNNHKKYDYLKIAKFRVKRLAGYSQYYDKVFH